MKIENFTSKKTGRAIPNQFIIYTPKETYFQSYKSIILKITLENGKGQVYLDKIHWDYSNTTGKYRNQILGENKKETEKKIKEGIYILTDLNKEEL